MKHNFRINCWFEKLPIIAVLANNIVLLRDIAFLLAISINLMVLLSYEYPEGSGKDASSENNSTDAAIKGVGTVVIVLASIIVTYNLLRNGPILMGKAWVGAK